MHNGEMADEVVIYSSATCGWAIRNYAALYEKGVPFNVLDVKTSTENRAVFLRYFPYALTPGLRHGETAVWDSVLINEYIDSVFSGVPLAPSDPAERARARQWIHHCDNVVFPALRAALKDPQALPDLQRKLDQLSLPSFLEEEPAPFWGGTRIGLVDLAYHLLFKSLGVPGLEQVDVPGWMRAWAQAVAGAPSVIRAEGVLESMRGSPIA
jgi:glutathione S-transferase